MAHQGSKLFYPSPNVGRSKAGPFDAWLILTAPDGKPATLIKLGVGLKVQLTHSSIFTHVVEKVRLSDEFTTEDEGAFCS